MTVLISICTAIGVCTVILFLVATVVAVFCWIGSLIEIWNRNAFNEGMQHRAELLRDDAWWFSESQTTCNLLLNLSKGIGVSEVREIWREDRKQEARKAAGLSQ